MASQDKIKTLELLRKRMAQINEQKKSSITEGVRPATTSTKPVRPATLKKEEVKVVESDAEFEDDEEVEDEVEEEVEDEVPYMEVPKFPPSQQKPVVKSKMRTQQPVNMPQFQPQMPLEEEIPFEPYNPPVIEETPSKEKLSVQTEEQLRIMQLEIERLQNNGTFRAELLYQMLQVNTHLGRISASLQKLAGG